MKISDELWERALNSAHRQLESYARQGQLSNQDERRRALNDALQHAVGIIQAANFSPSDGPTKERPPL